MSFEHGRMSPQYTKQLKDHMKYWSFIVLLVASCNLNMAYEKRITKGYYLIATDAMDQLDISRELETGDYIGRIPAIVRAYAVVNDTLIFARTTAGYYVLNTARDHDFAEVEDVVVGPLDQATFKRNWLNQYNVKFKSPE